MALDDFWSSIPLIGSIFDTSQDEATRQFIENQRLMEGLKSPDLEFTEFRPEVADYSDDYSPEAMLAQMIKEDPSIRGQMLDSIRKQQYLAETGLSDVDNLGFARASSEASQDAQRRAEAIKQNAIARGVYGGGQELAMNQMESQSAANRQQQQALQQAAEAARQRALYQQAYGQSLSNLRGQDFDVNRANVDIANKFNQGNVSARNAAQLRNLEAQQQYGQYASGVRNEAQMRNIDERNRLKQIEFENEMARRKGISGANVGVAQNWQAINAARQADRNANLQAIVGGVKAASGKPTP